MFYKSPITDLIIFVVVVLLIFGPKRLPLLGRQLGHGMREFKDGITGKSKDPDASERPEIAQASAVPAPVAPPPAAPVAPPPAAASPEPQAVEAPAPVTISPERETGQAAAPDPRA